MVHGARLPGRLTDPGTSGVVPVVLATGTSGPFRSSRPEHFITARPGLRHVRTRGT